MVAVPRYVCFRSRVGVLSDYIDHWMKEKIRATEIGDESLRFLSKRYLNSPYGKMGMRQDRINKIPELTPEGDIHFINHEDTTEANPYMPTKIPAKLPPGREPGGLILKETTYELKEEKFRSGLL